MHCPSEPVDDQELDLSVIYQSDIDALGSLAGGDDGNSYDYPAPPPAPVAVIDPTVAQTPGQRLQAMREVADIDDGPSPLDDDKAALPIIAVPDVGQRIQAAREAADEFEANAERMRVRPVIRSAEEKAEIDALLPSLDDLDDTDTDAPATDLTPTADDARPDEFTPRIDWKRIYNKRAAKSGTHRVREALDIAQKRIDGAEETAKAAKAARKRRIQAKVRMRWNRTTPEAIKAKRLKVLLKATANPKGDKRIKSLRGREIELVAFKDAMTKAWFDSTVSLDVRYSDQIVAYQYNAERAVGSKLMDRNQAYRHRQIVEKLERPGGLWHRLK